MKGYLSFIPKLRVVFVSCSLILFHALRGANCSWKFMNARRCGVDISAQRHYKRSILKRFGKILIYSYYYYYFNLKLARTYLGENEKTVSSRTMDRKYSPQNIFREFNGKNWRYTFTGICIAIPSDTPIMNIETRKLHKCFS